LTKLFGHFKLVDALDLDVGSGELFDLLGTERCRKNYDSAYALHECFIKPPEALASEICRAFGKHQVNMAHISPYAVIPKHHRSFADQDPEGALSTF
jgi:hypothetical protein